MGDGTSGSRKGETPNWENAMKHLIERIESLTESQIAKTIMQQMGGRRAMMMIGAKNLTSLDRGLAFSWPNRQRSRGNYVEITLTGRDDYDMEFFNVSKKGKKSVKRFPGLYFDQLVPTFEGHTGWYMSM